MITSVKAYRKFAIIPNNSFGYLSKSRVVYETPWSFIGIVATRLSWYIQYIQYIVIYTWIYTIYTSLDNFAKFKFNIRITSILRNSGYANSPLCNNLRYLCVSRSMLHYGLDHIFSRFVKFLGSLSVKSINDTSLKFYLSYVFKSRKEFLKKFWTLFKTFFFWNHTYILIDF